MNPYKICTRAEKVIPGIETHVVKHAGHGAIFDQPEKVAGLMRAFVYEKVVPQTFTSNRTACEALEQAGGERS